MVYQVTKKQHILPKKSIERFYPKNKNCVHVSLFSKNQVFYAGSKNIQFITNRKWGENNERQSVTLEKEFQELSEKIINSIYEKKYIIFNEKQNNILNQFYTLLEQRSKAKYHTFDDYEPVLENLNNTDLNQEKSDELEANDKFLSNDTNNINRAVYNIAITLNLQSHKKHQKWGILTSKEYEFIVSDFYNQQTIPINPEIYLCQNTENKELTPNETIKFNTFIKKSAKNFYFAMELKKCGIVPDYNWIHWARCLN